MKKQGRRMAWTGIMCAAMFVVWTVLVRTVDVQNVGPMGTTIGFATMNSWFHRLTGVHLWVYVITDWLGLIPVCICLFFGAMGTMQMIRRKRISNVDLDLICLGVYYVLVVMGYLLFEWYPINYRPILIEGRLESSYPSSTTLLVLSVMPTLICQICRRLQNSRIKKVVKTVSVSFSAGMVIARLLSGVHWLTDIVGSVLLSAGLFCLYEASVISYDRGQMQVGGQKDDGIL